MKMKHPILGAVTLSEVAPGVYVTEGGHYIPYPMADDFFTNPPSPSFGVAKTGDTYRVILEFARKNAAEPYARNVFHYVLKGISGSPQFAAVATELLKQLFAALAGSGSKLGIASPMNNNYQFRRPRVQSLTSSTDDFTGSNTQNGANTANQGSVPLRSAIIMHKGTGKAGRSFAGRTYWPAPDESAQSAGGLEATSQTHAQNTADAMRELNLQAINNGATAAESVYSPSMSKSSGSIVATPITTNTIRTVLGSQRRRQSVT